MSKAWDQQLCVDLRLWLSWFMAKSQVGRTLLNSALHMAGKTEYRYPVNREAMDESIEILRQSVQEAKIGDKEKLLSLKRLKQYVS